MFDHPKLKFKKKILLFLPVPLSSFPLVYPCSGHKA